MPKETWRKLPWSKKYEVSSRARVRNHRTGKILRPRSYSRVAAGYQLSHNGKKVWYSAERLYNEVFHEKPISYGYLNNQWSKSIRWELGADRNSGKKRLCHICGRPTNNYWCDHCRPHGN